MAHVVGVLLVCCLHTNSSLADEVWDVAPYRVHVWMVLDNSPRTRDTWQGQQQVLEDLVASQFGAAWQLQIEPSPVAWNSQGEDGNALLPEWQSIHAVFAQLDATDKLFVVHVDGLPDLTFMTSFREYDCATRTWGPDLSRQTIQAARLGRDVFLGILTAFQPIGRIDRVRDDGVILRMRAGVLADATSSPLMPAPGDILRPILRRNDSDGQPREGGIQPVPWTVLQTQSRDRSTVKCQLLSGLASPLRTRSTRRVERYAITARPTHNTTTLVLRDKTDNSKPLIGYDVYRKDPESSAKHLVGRTDWQGQLLLERGDEPLQTLYIKNGAAVLSRLPLIVGFERQTVAYLTDDSARLEAEGFLTGIQEELVDVVVRRKIMAARIQQRIENNQLNEAEKMLDDMRLLPTREQMSIKLQDRQQMLTSNDRGIQARIDRLFSDTFTILSTQLNPSDIDELRGKINEARRNPPTPPASARNNAPAEPALPATRGSRAPAAEIDTSPPSNNDDFGDFGDG